MANPQKENGYTAIANELLEVFLLHKFSEYQRIIIMFIWRKTYGFRKKEDRISNSQFVKGTGIPKGNVSRTIKELKNKNVVICRDNKLSVNKNWEEWKVICRANKLLSVQQVQKKIQKKVYSHPSPDGEVVKKNMIRTDDNSFSTDNETVIDAHTNEVISSVPQPSGEKVNNAKIMKDLITWAVKEKRGGKPFLNHMKQFAALRKLRIARVQPDRIKERWDELEHKKYERIDFMTIVNDFDKKA